MPEKDDTMPYTTVPLGVMTNADAMVSLCFFDTELVEDFIDYSRRKSLSVSRQTDFTLHMLFSATYWYLTYLKLMNEKVTGTVHSLEQNIENSDLLNLMRLQKSLVLFNTSLKGNQVLLERLYRIYDTDFDTDLYEDLKIEMKQADNTVTIYSDILKSTMDAYGSIISNNVNLIMKRMTSITIILMVPTLIASFYGMNVKGLALANLPLSFYIITFIAAVFTVLAYLWLRHMRWF